MKDKGVDQKPSKTALFAALRRAIANIDFGDEKLGPDYLAKFFLPAHFRFFIRFRKIRENTKKKLNGFLPGLNEYMIARTAYFDAHFISALNKKISQIVILGAGYDSRAYRFAKINSGTKIFELDITPTQNYKKKRLKKARIDIPNLLKFVSINFNKDSIKDALEQAGYDHRKKTLFIWEGVSYYLKKEYVDETLDFVRSSSHSESAIVFDYTITLSDQVFEKYYGAQKFAQTMSEYHGNEELLFSIDEGEIGSFLEQRDLRVVEHLDNAEIERRYLLDDSGSLLGQITGHFRFVLAARNEI